MRDETNEILVWTKTFVIFIFAIVSAVFFFLYIGRYIQFFKAAGSSATLAFTKEEVTIDVAGSFPVDILLNTDNAFIRGTDIRIAFNPSFLQLTQLTPAASKTSSLKTYLPLRNTGFDEHRAIEEANKTGFIEFSAVTADTKTGKLTSPFSGIVVVANMMFRSIQPGKTTLSIVKQHPTHDSTIIDTYNPPNNILDAVNTLTITSHSPLKH